MIRNVGGPGAQYMSPPIVARIGEPYIYTVGVTRPLEDIVLYTHTSGSPQIDDPWPKTETEGNSDTDMDDRDHANPSPEHTNKKLGLRVQ